MKIRVLSILFILTLTVSAIPAQTGLASATVTDQSSAAGPGHFAALPSPWPASNGASISPSPTATPSAPAAATIGPEDYPAGVNPLTGLPAADPALLKLPPALVSISNFPVTARPQTGLSISPLVFEMYIGEGMTRFLALFYGKYASTATDISDTAEVGPVRSGRLPYESVRQLYNGFLVMAGAYKTVAQSLAESSNVYGSDPNNINSAMIDISKLEKIAEANQKPNTPPYLGGMAFSSDAPSGGSPAGKLWVFYNFLNQVEWNYDPGTGAYLRSQDKADGSGKFYPATDKLTGKQLAFQNVVVMFANHVPKADTLINVDLLYTKGRALLFRDGQVYQIYWNTYADATEKKTGSLGPIKFTDANGNPVAFKPGNSFIELVSLQTTVDQLQPGSWKVRYYQPAIVK